MPCSALKTVAIIAVGVIFGVVQHFVVELLGMRGAVEVQRDRDHVRLAIEASHDAGVAVLHE